MPLFSFANRPQRPQSEYLLPPPVDGGSRVQDLIYQIAAVGNDRRQDCAIPDEKNRSVMSSALAFNMKLNDARSHVKSLATHLRMMHPDFPHTYERVHDDLVYISQAVFQRGPLSTTIGQSFLCGLAERLKDSANADLMMRACSKAVGMQPSPYRPQHATPASEPAPTRMWPRPPATTTPPVPMPSAAAGLPADEAKRMRVEQLAKDLGIRTDYPEAMDMVYRLDDVMLRARAGDERAEAEAKRMVEYLSGPELPRYVENPNDSLTQSWNLQATEHPGFTQNFGEDLAVVGEDGTDDDEDDDELFDPSETMGQMQDGGGLAESRTFALLAGSVLVTALCSAL